jgi:small-conductance mechanosensitive channel
VQSAVELETQLAAFDHSPVPASRISASVRAATAPSISGRTTGDSIATQIVLRARLARPVAGFVAATSSLAAGAWIAALLAVVVAPSSGGERALIGIFAIAAILGVALLHVRALRPAWRSAPAVISHIGPAARALVVGGLTFGALELVTVGAVAVFGVPPLTEGARIIAAGLAAGLGLAWQRLRLDDRLRRRIG